MAVLREFLSSDCVVACARGRRLTMSAPTDIVVPEIRNPKHKMLADIYLRGGSATQAAIEAGYSVRTAGVQGAGILKRPEVAAYVRHHKATSTEITGISSEQITKELKSIALSNVADFTRLDDEGNLQVDFSRATREQLAAVSSVKTKHRTIYDNRGNAIATEQQSEFKLWDKLRAAELLGKDLGMFKEPEQRVVVDVADRLLRARSRVMQDVGTRLIEQDDT